MHDMTLVTFEDPRLIVPRIAPRSAVDGLCSAVTEHALRPAMTDLASRGMRLELPFDTAI